MDSSLDFSLSFNGTTPIYDPITGPGGYRAGARIARVQVLVALYLGISAFAVFCVLRKKYPHIYVANFSSRNYVHSISRQNLPRLPSALFGWVLVVYNVSEDQVLQHAGLDAAVFLGFFKMCIRALAVCVLLAIAIISPVRFFFTGRFDFPDRSDSDHEEADLSSNIVYDIVAWLSGFLKIKRETEDYESFLWMYTVFTYVFTFVILFFLYRQTLKIIAMRQQYLGNQCSITDRTIKLSGIPPVLRLDESLRQYINSLGVGEVESVCVVKEWNTLSALFKTRLQILKRLETQWVQYFHKNRIRTLVDLSELRLGPEMGESFSLARENNQVSLTSNREMSSGETSLTGSLIDQISVHLENSTSPPGSLTNLIMLNDDISTRPTLKKGWFGLFGPKVDAINYYNDQLDAIDKEITRNRRREFPPSSTAFITMNSVAQAQMLAQAVLDPKINHLITSLAPSPHDILWENLCLTRRERNTRIVCVMLFIGVISVLLVLPVRFLSNFLNIKSISNVAPRFAQFLEEHSWAEYLITGILPPYVFTIFNIVMPYFYIWITERQGYTSRGDEELSSVSKNFFYIFVNLFLVFTLFGTATLTDTTQLAYQLADSLQKLSLFYVDLIILQGIGIFPYKLILLGNLLKYPLKNLFWSKTPRNHLGLYKPPVFNFGLQLPQPILILIITVTYSVISTRILTAGLIYFIIGYFVFKYQLLYACIHPPHNTGKVWPLVVRRVMMGLLIFHTMMFGTLASEKAVLCASFIIPLPVLTLYLLWHFHKIYIPLSNFIALTSIENNELPFHGDEMESLIETNQYQVGKHQTLDERREFNQVYEYPHLSCDMEGPLIAVDYNEALYMGSDGLTVRKNIPIFH